MLASITKQRISLAVVVVLTALCVFLDPPWIPDLDELLAGALGPVVELEVWRR